MSEQATGTKAGLDALSAARDDLDVSFDAAERAEKSHDWWMRSLIERRRDDGGPMATAVARPRSADAVSALLAWANDNKVALVPFGLGSGVCGAVLAGADQVVLDLGALTEVRSIDETNLTVTVEPGRRGSELEEILDEAGFTMGHWPQSVALSSVGGWCATRASGQLSTLYGNIEDMLVGCEVALADGCRIRVPAVPRSATGSDLRELFLGSEGTLGVFTELTFRIHPKPEHSIGHCFTMPTLEAGLESLRQILRSGWRPAVTRLYDAVEAGRNFSYVGDGDRPVLLLLGEGARPRVETEMREVAAIVAAAGGEDQGSEPVDSWLEHRNHVPSFDDLLDQGLVVDTIEVAIGWDRIGELFETVTRDGTALDGVIAMSGHVSHCYTTGANIYFTFVGTQTDMDGALALYDRVWNLTMERTHALGGTVAHHHGIGRVRKRWLEAELGDAVDVLRTVKRALDPNGILNPGVLVDVD